MNITVYLGANLGTDPALPQAVQQLGRWIGESGNALVYGGRAIGNVLAPVIDVQGDVLPLEAGPVVIIRHRDILGHLDGTGGKHRQCGAQRHSQRQQQCSNAFHHAPSFRSVF